MNAWTGGHVRDETGIVLHGDPVRSAVPVERLVGLALRRNPRRVHLLVSTVLAKHVPTPPALALAAGHVLGGYVAARLDDAAPDPRPAELLAAALDPDERTTGADEGRFDALRAATAATPRDRPDVRVIGYAETATGLGHLVAEALGARYLHSTRHVPAPGAPAIGFEEEHSHATSHVLSPVDDDWLVADGTVVLVDDEISTGTTVINTVREMHAVRPQRHWVVASLIDLRSAADRARVDALAAELGTRIDVVALGVGTVHLPDDVRERAERLIGAPSQPSGAEDAVAVVGAEAVLGDAGVAGGVSDGGETDDAGATSDVVDVEVDVRPIRSARFGVEGTVEPAVVRRIADAIDPVAGDGSVLVLGSEEFIALPVHVADALRAPGRAVRFSTTTRSPIAPVDRDDYAIAGAIRFRSHDETVDGPGERFAYNLTRGGRRFDTIVFMPEPGLPAGALDAAEGVVAALRRVTARVVVVHTPAWHPPVVDERGPRDRPLGASGHPDTSIPERTR
ncbi:hypothetical protein HNR16_001644 [Pseudoclavibacter chungangensis]|nr:phosphoribosyltransferase domain-containing protein [Pseudoclavibacter chungangensis]NYJ66856.1 hypothetical protein [Pseudoclavibacter chungangensis]